MVDKVFSNRYLRLQMCESWIKILAGKNENAWLVLDAA
uniref:Uncharacterized protein n=1 Tax=Siphoviridae sp. ctGkF2 TaxID=2827823 RepID=A0A8S5TLV6_9CAUD|nr:MAG TPA: hypothetical protein [Siphoviridae sp. ctGkF2]